MCEEKRKAKRISYIIRTEVNQLMILMTINKVCRINSGSWKEEEEKRREKVLVILKKKQTNRKLQQHVRTQNIEK